MGARDLVAGLSVAGLMFPEAVAYAGIAGLAPQHALAAAIAGCLAYSVFGRSRFAIVSPTSSSAAILAATIAALPGSAADKLVLVTLMVAIVGLLFIAAGMLRLGNLAGFISRPVLRGFAFGLAITIIVKQLPLITGIGAPGGNIGEQLLALASTFQQWHSTSVTVGCTALVALLALRRYPFLPGAFIVLCAGIAFTKLFALEAHGVALVGSISMSLTWPTFSSVKWAQIRELLPYTFPLVLILFAESWGTIRSLSLRHGEPVSANRELCALGVANLASAMVQGMPVGAGFSAGSASEAAGADSRLTAVVAGLGLMLIIILGGGLVEALPEPVLAAVVIAALTHALDPRPLLRLFRLKHDIVIALAAAFGVIIFGVVNGIVVAVVLSLAALLRKLSTPYVAALGRVGKGHDFVDVARHPDASPIAGVAIWRPAQPLFFANADAILTETAARIARAPGATSVIVSLEESFDLDSTALDALLEFDTLIRSQGRRLQYARMHDRVRDLIGLAEPSVLAHVSYSVDDAVNALLADQGDQK
ncbi:SulP family inorganic anion transporter [Neorhizobium alkalisoli]|uniref:MFS superfamily sulfate permease-like transporter n=1 Tax=Neorhizobium alkalisoli TaxID=528178 RepID=A0A561QAK1_9HYPH|nr:SulP family inorganic anion transporter [Neorhizobium alkalisoli]TWF47389.1 MFS superfamily sulfate permease-like transporter [Neorhizobium alkalisoli]